MHCYKYRWKHGKNGRRWGISHCFASFLKSRFPTNYNITWKNLGAAANIDLGFWNRAADHFGRSFETWMCFSEWWEVHEEEIWWEWWWSGCRFGCYQQSINLNININKALKLLRWGGRMETSWSKNGEDLNYHQVIISCATLTKKAASDIIVSIKGTVGHFWSDGGRRRQLLVPGHLAPGQCYAKMAGSASAQTWSSSSTHRNASCLHLNLEDQFIPPILKVAVVDPPFIVEFTDFRLVLEGAKVKNKL